MTKKKAIAVQRAIAIVRKYFPSVNKVNDATNDVTVEVTGSDVNTGKRKNHEACAMAVACKRALKLDGVVMAVSTAYLVKGDTAVRFKVPEHLSREVVSFDRGAQFDAGVYTLKAPTETQRLGHGKRRGGSQGGHKKPKHFAVTSGIRSTLGSDMVR